jgi:sigma-B regulation protein RsbU (phosphoserine phosphatase)
MTSVYSIIHAYVASAETIDVPAIVSRLNDILCAHIIKSQGMFITLFVAYIDLETGTIEYCNGGHPPPYFYRASAREVTALKTGGPLVGQFDGAVYRSAKETIAAGDRIFCFTDGIIEAANRAGELYGLARLKQLFLDGVELDVETFARVVKEEVDRHSRGGDVESVDDFTTLVIDITETSQAACRYQLTYVSDLAELERLYRDFEAIAKRHAVPSDAGNSFLVAVSEAVTNAIVHAHHEDRSKKITVIVEIDSDKIAVEIADEGDTSAMASIEQVNPVVHPEAEGGRGLGLIRSLSDEATFERRPLGGTLVRITKRLKDD